MHGGFFNWAGPSNVGNFDFNGRNFTIEELTWSELYFTRVEFLLLGKAGNFGVIFQKDALENKNLKINGKILEKNANLCEIFLFLVAQWKGQIPKYPSSDLSTIIMIPGHLDQKHPKYLQFAHRLIKYQNLIQLFNINYA